MVFRISVLIFQFSEILDLYDLERERKRKRERGTERKIDRYSEKERKRDI